jgi:hypothetical protein
MDVLNMLDVANFIRRKGAIYDRTERIKREGSPPYVWEVPVTAASAESVIYVRDQFAASRKYEPLDSIEVINNESTNDLTLTINGGDTRKVPASSIRTVHGRGVALWHIGITNDGSVNTTLGDIVVTLQKEPMTIDKWAQDRS